MAPPKSERVTRSDVARVAGTSVAVVSYVINNGPRPVAEATRERVLAAIKQTGYRPNGVARALASGSTKTYGLVVPNISNPFVASMAHRLLHESMRHGHVMLLGDAGDDRKREQEVIQGLLSRQVDGLFYTSVDRQPWIEMITASGTPLVMLDRVEVQPGVSILRVDERYAAFQATHHLLSHGYPTIAMIAGPLAMQNAQDRIQGWRDALQGYGMEPRPELIFSTSYTRQGGYDATQRILALPQMPRALFTSNEAQAMGCLRALQERGLRVPDDVALVSFNGTDQSGFHVPAITTMRQPVDELARRAIAMLKSWDGEARVEEFPHYLEIGESCGCSGTGKIMKKP
ncbi:LacI family DNA-binding transcriptional regulator [Pantoea sp. A4]|uniref:LacI family DNA-binding transcriptional regulator n=1 Tax=Pantoea sp. A4 TaxID=1225184 RepID=UPI0003743218|nr:LacI family DNA-binding transcriptional regulator [Pantoea sp. A4]